METADRQQALREVYEISIKEFNCVRWSSDAAEFVTRAWWGDPRHAWTEGPGCGVLCTDAVVSELRASDRIVATNEALGQDPAPGVGKVLIVEVLQGHPRPTEPDDTKKPRVFASPAEVLSAPRWVAFIRHAQAGHNVDKALLDNPDNALTQVGREQALASRDGEPGLAVRAAELVVTSPLKRALQTTGLLLGSVGAGVEGPRVLVDPLQTERRGATCDEGNMKSELLADLPGECSRDWEGWDVLPEQWWPEPGEDMWGRAEAFVESVKRRPEDRIAFVGHGAFWQMVLGRHLSNCEVVYCDRLLSP